MDGKEQIVNKIIQDAEEKASSIINNANSKADIEIKTAEEQAKKLTDENKVQVDESAKILIERRQTVANIDAKKAYLSSKQQMVDEVYEKALDLLLNMGEKDYLAYIEKRLTENAISGDKVILSRHAPVSENDVLGLSVCKKLNLTVEKTGDFSGGFILETEICDKNLSFEAVIKEYKSATVALVAEKLFG